MFSSQCGIVLHTAIPSSLSQGTFVDLVFTESHGPPFPSKRIYLSTRRCYPRILHRKTTCSCRFNRFSRRTGTPAAGRGLIPPAGTMCGVPMDTPSILKCENGAHDVSGGGSDPDESNQPAPLSCCCCNECCCHTPPCARAGAGDLDNSIRGEWAAHARGLRWALVRGAAACESGILLAEERRADSRIQSAEHAWRAAARRQHQRVRMVEAFTRRTGAGSPADARGGGRAQGAVLPCDGRGRAQSRRFP